MIITKFFEALLRLDKPNTPDLSDPYVSIIFKQILEPLTDDAIRNVYIKVRECDKFPTIDKFKEFAGYLSDDKQKNRVVNEWEHFLLTGNPLTYTANFYFIRAGGMNRFRHMSTTDSFLSKRLKDILESVWWINGPKYPSEFVKKADEGKYLPKRSHMPDRPKEDEFDALSSEQRKILMRQYREKQRQARRPKRCVESIATDETAQKESNVSDFNSIEQNKE